MNQSIEERCHFCFLTKCHCCCAVNKIRPFWPNEVMISYNGGAFGFKILFRLHGSAVAKSLTPALLSSVIYILLAEFSNIDEDEIFDHPYPIGALVSAFSFLLVFRANFSYHRYWDALTAIHTMHSKWLDFATDVAAFHYQSERYNDQKPPAFGNHPNLHSITRERHRRDEMTTIEELQTERKMR